MKNYMTEEEWIRLQEEFEDDMTPEEFREAMDKMEKEKPENGRKR